MSTCGSLEFHHVTLYKVELYVINYNCKPDEPAVLSVTSAEGLDERPYDSAHEDT